MNLRARSLTLALLNNSVKSYLIKWGLKAVRKLKRARGKRGQVFSKIWQRQAKNSRKLFLIGVITRS